MRAQAADELRDRILTGRLQPGDRLDLDRLTAEFGISRTPVREALLELSYEGLVAITPRSGIAVVGITPQDAVDNFAVLAALAGKAAEMATARITPDELTELAVLADAVARLRRRGRGQPALPPGGQSRSPLAPPADLRPPGGAGRAGQLLRARSPNRSSAAATSTPRSSTPWRAVTGRRRAPSPRRMCSTAGEALGEWLSGITRGHVTPAVPAPGDA